MNRSNIRRPLAVAAHGNRVTAGGEIENICAAALSQLIAGYLQRPELKRIAASDR